MLNKLKVRSDLRIAIVALAVALVLASAPLTRTTSVQAGSPPTSQPASSSAPGGPIPPHPTPVLPNVPASPEDTVWVCTPSQVGATTLAVIVVCTAPLPGGFDHFASPTSNPTTASLFMSALTTAFVTGKNMYIWYNQADATSGPAFGCDASNCRPIKGAWVLP